MNGNWTADDSIRASLINSTNSAERTFAWAQSVSASMLRYDKRADIHDAFLSLGCGIC
jgi:hypothetical protein